MALLVWGRDLVCESLLPLPDRAYAQHALPCIRDNARHAAGLDDQYKSEFPLPSNATLRLRKFARLAVLAGAYLLMAIGRFRSFGGSDVLPALRTQFPQWSAFLQETEFRYIAPSQDATEALDDYVRTLLSWLDFVASKLGIPTV